MKQTPERDNIKYSILTNGLMFKEFHTKVPYVINNLQDLGISIDGATKETYEKLRLGGKWEKIKSNLQSIADSKHKYDFCLKFHMVVQQDNWWEMKAMAELAESYGVDEIYFNIIQDWNTALDHSKQTFMNLKEFKDLRDEVRDMSIKYIVAGL
jgi:sulfatase maturation enzyme AslB (radical SAM superfamily)